MKKVSLDKKTLEKIAHPRKFAILLELKRKDKINQLELKKKLNISYREVRRYIKQLEKVKLVKTKKIKNKLGSPTIVSFNGESKKKAKRKIYKV